MPRWKVEKGKSETICYDSTWAAAGSAHMQSAFPTCVSVQYNEGGLEFSFIAYNDNVQQNSFTKCDSDMYNQEVVEVFITSDMVSVKPENYLEVEMTPTGGQWVGDDYNPGGERQNFSNTLLPCNLTAHSTANYGPSSWRADLSVPFDMIGRAKAYRANFFRVQMSDAWRNVKVTSDMTCSPDNCTFSCANCPTTAGPDFHHSAFFGVLELVD